MTPQALDWIHTLVIHCSATKEGQFHNAADIDKWHKARGWSMIGYHRVYLLDGSVEQGRPYTRRGAHVKGNNINTLGLCMIGGLNSEGKAKNTFTNEQFHSVFADILNIRELCKNITEIKGHRDFSPDLNGDGLITPNEWMKQCPCFDVDKWLETLRYTV
jgi:N-acetylmuramoyl-L-alanine amidase